MKKSIFILAALLASSDPVLASGLRCEDLFTGDLSPAQIQMLKSRYGLSSTGVHVSPELKVPVLLKTDGPESLAPRVKPGIPVVRELKTYDVVIVGGGPAGLTAALYLAEAGQSVLILERNPRLGGLGDGDTLQGVQAAGGAAYSAGPGDRFEYSIFQKIGLGNYKKKLSIHEPIDSYLWNGKLYEGIWEEHALQELPASFRLFRHALLKLVKQGAGKEEGSMAEWTDSQNMASLVRQMPELVRTSKDRESREIYQTFLNDPKVPRQDPMKDVLGLLDLYGRSALGGTTEKISARQYIDFYESELYTRYTGTLGTGTITAALVKKLKGYSHLVDMRVSAPVASLENTADGTRTVFLNEGAAHEVNAKKAIFAASLKLAPKLIKDLEKQDPEKSAAINSMEMSDYVVHVARLKGHPFRATYDTWSFSEGDHSKPTDFILGRWQDDRMRSYDGLRDFEKNPIDDRGVITIYHPLGKSDPATFSTENTLKLVDTAVSDMMAKLSPQAAAHGEKIEVELIETYRWPESIHIVEPGYLQKSPLLARPTGNIHYANNTIAAPELETTMGRAVREVQKILAEGTAAQKKAQ